MNNCEALRNTDISACNTDGIADLKNIEINRKMPLNLRINDFIAQVGNPYLFKVGDIVIKLEFGDGKDFSEILTNAILAG